MEHTHTDRTKNAIFADEDAIRTTLAEILQVLSDARDAYVADHDDTGHDELDAAMCLVADRAADLDVRYCLPAADRLRAKAEATRAELDPDRAPWAGLHDAISATRDAAWELEAEVDAAIAAS